MDTRSLVPAFSRLSVAALLVVVGAVAGSAQSGTVLNEPLTGRQIFLATNWWNLDISRAPVDPRSPPPD